MQQLARRSGALLVIDDIQAGVGRTDGFFSFEKADLSPDIVILSKSLSGLGTPFALVLLRPEHDIWTPGEHNGTFRGNNLAFVAAEAAINTYWSNNEFQKEVARRAARLNAGLDKVVARLGSDRVVRRGRGMFTGLAFFEKGFAERLSAEMFAKGVIIETCGPENGVLKFLAPLTITETEIDEVLGILDDVIVQVTVETSTSGLGAGGAAV